MCQGAGGPCWVSGPAPHSRGLETRPGSGAGLGGLQPNPPAHHPPQGGGSSVEPPSRGSHMLQPQGQGATWSLKVPSQTRTPPGCCGASSGTKITPPAAPPGFEAMLSWADCAAECPGLPAGTLLSPILIIISRNHRHAAPHDPWRLQSGVPGGGPHIEPRGCGVRSPEEFLATAVVSKPLFLLGYIWHGQRSQLSPAMGRWEDGAGARILLDTPTALGR